MMMSSLEFSMLGPLEVRRGGEPVPITAPRLRALLSLLLLRANEPVAQSELLHQLWDGTPPDTARAAFHNAIHALRRTLGRDVLEQRNGSYILKVPPESLDLVRFRLLVAEARSAGPQERASKLRHALACWRGPADFHSNRYARTELRSLEEERLTTLEERIDADLALGRGAELVAELERLLGSHPTRERFWTQLMLALYQAGRQADALATYRRAHEAFDDLGLAPGVVLRELQRAILVQDPALADPTRRFGSTLERAAMTLPRQPREQAESLLEYGVALFRLSEPHHARTTLEAAERIARASGEIAVAERAQLELSWMSLFVDGWTTEHLAVAERAAEVFGRLGDDRGHALALRHCAHVLRDTGRADEAATHARRAVVLAEASGANWEAALCRSMLALSLAMGSMPVLEAVAECEELDSVQPRDGRPPHGVWSALVLLHAQAGDDTRSVAMAEELIALTTAAGAHVPLSLALLYAGMAAAHSGRLGDAAAYFRRSRSLIEEMPVEHAAHSAELAVVLSAMGAEDEAEAIAMDVRARCTSTDFVLGISWRRALALTWARRGRGGEALSLADEAAELTRGSDDLALHGHTLEDRATVLLLVDEAAAARDALGEALAVYRRKGHVPGERRAQERLEAAR
jgi:DNA-binding SARP family transcriptional activator